jgi:hypothetical protein
MPWDVPTDPDDFGWSEGNFSCDCNRAQFFAEAKGLRDPDLPCSDGRFSVRVAANDGSTIYSDGVW